MQRKQSIDRFHQQLLCSTRTKHGFYLSGWSSENSQRDRFAALLKTSHFTGGRVIDYGCGTGDLYAYICNLGLPFEYKGLDQNEGMVEIAKLKYGDRFECIALDEVNFGMVDFVFASGVCQFRDPEVPDYYNDLIYRLFSSCHRALSVNFLSALRDEVNKVPDEQYLNPNEVVVLAQRISKFWIIDHSYHVGGGDMTLGLHKRNIQKEWRRTA